jgi:hypothetical protein
MVRTIARIDRDGVKGPFKDFSLGDYEDGENV